MHTEDESEKRSIYWRSGSSAVVPMQPQRLVVSTFTRGPPSNDHDTCDVTSFWDLSRAKDSTMSSAGVETPVMRPTS